MTKYFLIENSDGDTTVSVLTEAQLRAALKDRTDGVKPEYHPVFLKAVADANTNYWGDHTVLIIKGEIVVPQPVQVATEYKL